MVLGTISDNMTQNHYFTLLFGQTPLRNSIAMAIPKVPGDQNYLKGCVIRSNQKSQSFSFLHLVLFPSKIGLKPLKLTEIYLNSRKIRRILERDLLEK